MIHAYSEWFRRVLDIGCPTCGVPDGWGCRETDAGVFHTSRVRAAGEQS